MSKELDYFFNMHISAEDKEQAEELDNLIENNQNLIMDYDIDFTDEYGNPIEGSVFLIQFGSVEAISKFSELLIEIGYEI